MTTPDECPWSETARIREERAQARVQQAAEQARLREFERSARLALARYERSVLALRVALGVVLALGVGAAVAVAW